MAIQEHNLELKEISGTFFTEDDVQVFTIYFENVPENEGSHEELVKYFSKFGEINKLQIEKHYKTFSDKSKISGICQYEQPESAYRALTHTHKNNYVVLPADSWLQPTILTGNLETIEEKSDDCSLRNQLNDDCLMNIYDWLTLRDLVILTTVFHSLKLSLKRFLKSNSKDGRPNKVVLNTKEVKTLTLMQVRQFLIEFGELIDHLEILDWPLPVKAIRYLNLALHFCRQLKSLRISSISFKNKEFGLKIARNFSKLEKLSIINCRLDDNDIFHMSTLSHVKYLELSGNNNCFKGLHLHTFRNLKELYLKDCEDLHSAYFDQMNFSNLEILDVTGCHLGTSSFKSLAKYAKKIRILKISLEKIDAESNHFEIYVPEMQSLEELIITNSSRTGCTGFYIEIPKMENRLKMLSESKYLKNNLKVLHLKYFKINVDYLDSISKFASLTDLLISFSHEDRIPLDFWEFIEALPNLKSLGLKIDAFKSFDVEFLKKLISFLNRTKVQNTQFIITADISKKVYTDLLQDPTYEKSKANVKVVPYYLSDPFSIHGLGENTSGSE